MLQLTLHTWSGKKKGFARTKVIFWIGVFVIIAVLLSLFPNMVSNTVELDTVKEREDLNDETDNVMNQESSADADADADAYAIEDLPEAGESSGNASNNILYGERISLTKDELKYIRFRPIFKGDYQVIGLEIRRLGYNNVLTKLGLQQRDIIKSINGKKIQNVGDLESIIFWEVSKPRMDVEIERNNESLVVTYIVEAE